MAFQLIDVPVARLHPNPSQPRKVFVELEELARSLREEGQQTPLLVRPVGDGYEIVQGERRWRAAQLAGLPTLRAEVRDLTDAQAFRLALVENLQRANLTPIEEAEAFALLAAEGMNQAAIGELVGRGQSYVSHKLRLRNAPEPLQAFLAMGALDEGHLRQLLRLEHLYPEGLENSCDLRVLADMANEDDPEVLLDAYNLLRPEDNPPLPLWLRPRQTLAECSQAPALWASFRALGEYVTRHNRLPQWVLAAWWYGSAAVLWNMPVHSLKASLDYWHERYLTALMWVAIHPNPPEGYANASQQLKDDISLWWCYKSDLRHSSSADLGADGEAFAYHSSAKVTESWPLPTAMQEYGTQHKTGYRIRARSQARKDRQGIL